MMELQAKAGVGGYFYIDVYDANGVLKEHLGVKNRILDIGLNRLANWSSSRDFCEDVYIGTGTTPVQDTDTDLANGIATKARDSVTGSRIERWGYKPYYVGVRFQYTFAVGAVNATITELGVGSQFYPVGQRVNSRVVLATPVVVLPTDTLVVTYQLYYTIPEDQVINVSDGTTTYAVTVRPLAQNFAGNEPFFQWALHIVCQLGSGSTWCYARESDALLPITTNGSQAASGASQNSEKGVIPYVSGSYVGKGRYKWLGDKANFPTGIGTITYDSANGQGIWQFSFSPKLPKTAQKILTVIFKLAYDRANIPDINYVPPLATKYNFDGAFPTIFNPALAANWSVQERGDGTYTKALGSDGTAYSTFTINITITSAAENNFGFRAQVSAQYTNSLRMYVDGVNQNVNRSGNGTTPYFWYFYTLSVGTHAIKFEFSDPFGAGERKAWISQLGYN